MATAEVLRVLQEVPSPHKIFPSLDTPFCKYSGYYAASDGEFPAIRKIISERKEQIDGIDAIIQRVEIILHQFREKHKQIVSSMKMHEGMIAGIRRLPLEILKEIFIHCLPSDVHLEPAAKAAPLLLTRICRRWREVALDTPGLWSSLVLKDSDYQLSNCHGWIEKAKAFPLSLKVDISSAVSRPGWRKAVLDFVQVYHTRLRNFNIIFDAADGLSMLFNDIPMLEHLSLSGDLGALREAQAISIVQPQPCLHTLTIHSPYFDMEIFSGFNPGWTNLTHLAVVLGVDQSDFLDPILLTLLQTCLNLEHVVFSPVLFFCRNDSVSFTHPKLRLLDVATILWEAPPLHTLTLPNLHYLCVREFRRYESVPLEDVFIPEHTLVKGNPHRILNIEIETPIDSKDDYYEDCEQKLFTFVNPGWTDLTHLRMNFTRCKAVFRVLSLCPNLEDLVILSAIIDQSRYRLDSEGAIIHPVLRSLSIEIICGPVCELLNMLKLPSLYHLDLSFAIGSPWPHDGFKDFLSLSECPLDTLKIRGADVSIEEREEFGLLIPTLKRVDLYDFGVRVTDAPAYSWTR